MTALTRRNLCLMTATAMIPPVVSVAAPPGTATSPARERASGGGEAVTLFVAVGARLVAYRPDTLAMTLVREAGPGTELAMPAAIQYAWRHPGLPLLYVAYSDRVGTGPGGTVHGVQAVRLGSGGRMTPFGDPLRLDNRPINITADGAGRTLLVAFNLPSALRTYPLSEHGLIGPEIEQPEAIDAGIYAHQVRVTPDDRTAILVTRGNDARPGKAEDPGALKVFSLKAGRLRLEQTVAPDRGYGFGPRHLDFASGQPVIYVSMERQNALETFRLVPGGLSPAPVFRSTTLGAPALPGLRQLAGPIHVSPDGRFVYVANRADSRRDVDGQPIFAGGENTMAVFQIDAQSGEPRLIQTVETGRFHPRTFSIHPDGTMLISAAIEGMSVLDGGLVRAIPAGLTVFRIRPSGTLERVQQIDIETRGETVFWCGMVRRPI